MSPRNHHRRSPSSCARGFCFPGAGCRDLQRAAAASSRLLLPAACGARSLPAIACSAQPRPALPACRCRCRRCLSICSSCSQIIRMEQKLNPFCSWELMEGIEVPAGFAHDEIGQEIPKDAPPQCTARTLALLPLLGAAVCALLHRRAVARAPRCCSSEKKLVCLRSTF